MDNKRATEHASTLAVIPARANSKRIPRKNIREFNGKPIIAYSIEAAIRSEVFDHIAVSTDSKEIAEIALEYGAEVPFLRPDNLADDYCSIGEAFHHTIDWYKDEGYFVDYACCIYACAPLVSPEDIRKGIAVLKENTSYAMSLAVTEYPYPIQRALKIRQDHSLEMIQKQYEMTRSQDLDACYHDAGQFFWRNISKPDHDKENRNIEKKYPIIVDRLRVQDIDTVEDWRAAECQYNVFQVMEEKKPDYVF